MPDIFDKNGKKIGEVAADPPILPQPNPNRATISTLLAKPAANWKLEDVAVALQVLLKESR